ncbi:hypothetical protein QTP88_026989 [Uroleucon formosanum]
MDNYLAAGWLRGSVINDKGIREKGMGEGGASDRIKTWPSAIFLGTIYRFPYKKNRFRPPLPPPPPEPNAYTRTLVDSRTSPRRR